MDATRKFTADEVLRIGRPVTEQVALLCERVQIAGSVRRGKESPKDLEIIGIPIRQEYQHMDLFGPTGDVETRNLMDAFAPPEGFRMLRNGTLYKQAEHLETGLRIDIFLGTERNWGGLLTIRTGPRDFSQALVTLARRRGLQVSGGYYIHRHPTKLDENGKAIPCQFGDECAMILPTPEEGDFFRALGIAWAEPGYRDARYVWKIINAQR